MASRRLLLALLFSVACPAAWAQSPEGAEFRVNSYTTNGQHRPTVASDANGNFVVVWQSRYQDGSGYGVFGQRFNASGVPEGSEFQVNSYTTGYQVRPAVASDADGDFVVVWGSSFGGVFGQRFNALGVPQGSELQVNSGSQASPVVASAPNGDFVVAWTGQDGSGNGVLGQRFDAAGISQGSEFQVNSYTTGSQERPAVASDANGNSVVSWFSQGQDGSAYGVFGQRFNALGVPQGSELQVNSYTTGYQTNPAVAPDAVGNFVVVWRSRDQDGSGYGVFGQRFNAVRIPQGSEFQANSFTTSHQSDPVVASDATGNFVVVWRGAYPQDGSSYVSSASASTPWGFPRGASFKSTPTPQASREAPRWPPAQSATSSSSGAASGRTVAPTASSASASATSSSRTASSKATRLTQRLRGATYLSPRIRSLPSHGGKSVPATLVDSSVLLEVLTEDSVWFEWSSTALAACADQGPLVLNPIAYAEASIRFSFSTIEDLDEALAGDFVRLPLPWAAAFLAGKCFVV